MSANCSVQNIMGTVQVAYTFLQYIREARGHSSTTLSVNMSVLERGRVGETEENERKERGVVL